MIESVSVNTFPSISKNKIVTVMVITVLGMPISTLSNMETHIRLVMGIRMDQYQHQHLHHRYTAVT